MLFFIAVTMHIQTRLRQSLLPASMHLGFSIVIASFIAGIIFWIWYPWPYHEFSGGRDIFLLLIGVDIVCGPVLTLLLFTTSKPKKLLYIDLGLICAIQMTALLYGVATAWSARPIYLVAEIDRFKVITRAEISDGEIEKLPDNLRTAAWKKPMVIGIREPVSTEERNKVLFESLQGGRDYAERPEFYVAYADHSAKKSLEKSKRLVDFIKKYPGLGAWSDNYARTKNVPIETIRYLPVRAREDWIAILDENGYVADFVKGDGF